MATIIERKKRRIDEVDFGTIVLIENLHDSEGEEIYETVPILDKLYMVVDESSIFNEEDMDITYGVNLKSGYLCKFISDVLVTEVDCKIIADI